MTPTRVVTAATLLLALLLLGAPVTAQFRARTDLVELGAVVLDQRGDPVPGLAQADFEIVEDGHPVPVSTFVAINADQPATVNDGRFLALLVETTSTTARQLARDLINRMGERDVVAILSLNGSKAKTTDDRQVALQQLEDLTHLGAMRARSGFSSIGAMPSAGCAECGTAGALGIPGYPGMSVGGPMTPSSSHSGYTIQALDQMSFLAGQLGKVEHRRKSLVYIGPGSPLNMTPRDIKDGDSGRWFDVIRQASRADVSVSVIGIEGLTGRSYAGARMLAEQTGGEAVVDTNTYGPGVERLWQRAGQYYLLGYAPGSAKKKRHSIDVRVKRPDVDVHALKTRAADQPFGFHAKYTGTPSSTITSPGHVVAGR